MTPEGLVKKRVKKVLEEYGVYKHMPVMNGMGKQTLDFITCAWGRFLAIETKAEGNKPTENQYRIMKEIRDSGGFAIVVEGVGEVDTVLIPILNWLRGARHGNAGNGTPSAVDKTTV